MALPEKREGRPATVQPQPGAGSPCALTQLAREVPLPQSQPFLSYFWRRVGKGVVSPINVTQLLRGPRDSCSLHQPFGRLLPIQAWQTGGPPW